MNPLPRNRWVSTRIAALTAAVLISATTASAEGNKIVQIEEHWELAIGEPDSQMSAPQATMVMSPGEELNGQYFLFTINHRSVPEYQPGGMQVQLWNGNDVVDAESASAEKLTRPTT